jgi:hypothetical protein
MSKSTVLRTGCFSFGRFLILERGEVGKEEGKKEEVHF